MSAPAAAAPTPPSIEPGSWDAWRVALRPKTLWIATIPVIVGTCLAWSLQGAYDTGVALIALTAAVMMQVVTNLQNDVGYTERGGETGTRVGLPRATANGWLGTRDVKRAIVAAIVVAQFVGAAADDPRRLADRRHERRLDRRRLGVHGRPAADRVHALRRAVVFVFFGLVAVGGTWYVQAGTLGAGAVIAGAALGMHAAAVLLVNNFRDRAHDVATGRRTLAVVLGRERLAASSTRRSCSPRSR